MINPLNYVTRKFEHQSLSESSENGAKVASEDRDSGTESDDEQTYEEPEIAAFSEMSSELSSGCSVRSRPTSQTSTDTLTCEDLPIGGDAPDMPPPTTSQVPHYSQSHGGQQHMVVSSSTCCMAPASTSSSSAHPTGNCSSHGALGVPPVGRVRTGGTRTPKQQQHSHGYLLRTSEASGRGVATHPPVTAAAPPPVVVESAPPFLQGVGGTPMILCEACDPVEHHSSEEELETLTGPWLRDGNGAPEKRKWSQRARLSLTDSGSSDDEVCGLTTGTQPPVKFRTSPPLQVHKPLRSVSPPPKMQTLSASQRHQGSAAAAVDKTSSSSSQTTTGENECHGGGGGGLSARGGDAAAAAAARAVSPRKRHRHTPRPYRPSLDFEKMQQMKNRAVTQWRNGGELSLSFF